MGEVYRARDESLRREVAIKVLPAAFSSDSDRLRRFEQEARAASAIAHPNIVTIHEIGQTDSAPYIVMELVEGKSLRTLLDDGPMPQRPLLQIAVQIADGLAAAHARGIVHRDLKPENVMVTPSGVVKILDFGLARHAIPSRGPTESTMTSPIGLTEPGTILGTASYMSPEQARGSEVDFRTDQFSFGSVLYEMATGRKAFKRDSIAETMVAILREEPLSVRGLAPATPAPLRWIIERCFAKEREFRYDSTRDLARDLRSLQEHVSEIESVAGVRVELEAARSRGPGRAWAATVVTIGLLAAGAIVVTMKWRSPAPLPTFRRLTFQRGHVTGARFAPDGQTVIYSAAWEGRPSEIFSMHLSGPEFRPLGISPARLAAVSDAGEMAFLSTTDVLIDELATWSTGTLAFSPLSGGAPREVRELVVAADFSRDGKSVAAVVQRRAGPIEQEDLEYPLGTRLATGLFFNRPRIAPDGNRVAVIEILNGKPVITTIDRQGKRQVLSKGWRLALNPVWSPTGEEVWFSAGQVFPQTLFAADLKGKARELMRIPGILFLEDVFRDGRALVKQQSSRTGIISRPAGDGAERDLSWFEFSDLADISLDGKLLLFTERGGGRRTRAAYVRKTDGSAAVRLGEGEATAFSPDAKWALSGSPDSESKLVLLPIGPGLARTFDLGSTEFSNVAGWSSEGNRLLYWGIEPDRLRSLHELTLSTGQDRRVGSIRVVIGGPLSPDGKKVSGCAEIQKCGIFALDGGPPLLIPGWGPSGFAPNVVAWEPDGRSVYVSDWGMPLKISRVRLEDGRSELWKELRPADPAGISRITNVKISPATGAYAYSYERVLSDLYLVEGLK